MRPVEANRQEAGGVCLSGEASVNIGWEKVEADRGGQARPIDLRLKKFASIERQLAQ